MIGEKRPRHYAAEFLALKTKQEKIDYVQSIPVHLRGLTKRHVLIAGWLQKGKAK